MDDEFHHSLAVWQDEKCGGLRLVASVLNGELAKCPVWVAFGAFVFYYFVVFLRCLRS